MTLVQMKAIYDLSRMIYEGKITLTDGKEKANRLFSINVNSFADYYRAFEKMREGKIHTRIIGSSLREYMLERILSDYGKDALNRALESYMLSIEFYEDSHQGQRLRKDKKIYEKFLSKL